MIRFLVAVALLVALPVAAQADTAQDHPLKDFHPKAATCQWFLHAAPIDAPGFLPWAQGFMSGLNMARLIAGDDARDLQHFEPIDIDHQTRVYCEQHPKDGYDFAVQNVYRNRPLVTGSAALFQARPRN